MHQKRKGLLGGVAVLGVAGIIVKVLGMFFQVPLGNLIGLEGLGVYQRIYPYYNLLLTISAAGMPVAISRLVSESATLGLHREAKDIHRIALTLLAAVGTLLTVLLVLISGPLSGWIASPETRLGFIAIAPSILIVSVLSAYRGYLQGMQQMTPTAISQIIEQVVKVAVALPLAWLGNTYGGVSFAAAGALLGITISEGFALLFMVIMYHHRHKHFEAALAQDVNAPTPYAILAKRIIRIALPITLGSMIVPLCDSIDSTMIPLRLIAIGYSAERAQEIYGSLSGVAIRLVNVPTALATAICISLVPVISEARTNKQTDTVHKTSNLGLRLASLISFPCALGMSMLAKPIIQLLYPSFNAESISISAEILTLSAWSIIFFTHVQASTGILQGAGYHKVPVYSLLLGVVCKVTLNYFLVGKPSIGIIGAPIASIVCYAVSMAINEYWIIKKAGMRMDWTLIFVRPALSATGMGLAVWLAMRVFDMELRWNTLLVIAIGVCVYVVLAFACGAVKREDIKQIPGSGKS